MAWTVLRARSDLFLRCHLDHFFLYINNNIPFAVLGFTMSGSLLAFLCYNFPPAKIFMGDSGSMMIGLVNAILFIKFVQTAGSATAYPVSSSIGIGFCFIIIPLLDVLRVFIIRLTKGVSHSHPIGITCTTCC